MQDVQIIMLRPLMVRRCRFNIMRRFVAMFE
jgi:hypothetical protein